VCGIAGHAGPRPLDPERVARTLELMRHRGPDDQTHRGFTTPDGRHVDLLHARLSIIDLDPRSNQPLHLDGAWMAYNGELYNYVEVRKRLEDAGHGFVTESDTEVLLRALRAGGWEALDGCEGMWGFAVYDERSGDLDLVRDRFGEKPLYILRDGEDLYFGSEVKFIAALLGRRLQINERHLHRYLVNGYKALYKSKDTFFAGVEELGAGTRLTVGAGGAIRSERYWTVPRPVAADRMSWDEAVAGVRERLVRATEIRLRADVPLAFCMSGGVDSMSLISIAKQVFGYDVHGFTIMNSDERYEESDLIEHSISKLGLRHTPIALDTHEFLPRLRALVVGHDAPVYTISYYVHWLLMQSIHEHGYRISVSGSAADEIFSGYYDHHLAYLQEINADRAHHAVSVAAWREHVSPVVRNPFLQDPDYFVADPARREHIYFDADEFSAQLVKPFSEPFTETDYADGLLRNRMLNELFHESVPVILHEDDHNAMAFSIENRSPFLDRELLDFALTIPTRHLVDDGKAKAVLREAVRGIAPDAIIDNRRKVGFNAPILDLLDVHAPAVREELLADSPVFDHIRRDAVEDLLALEVLPNSRSKFLFNFICAKMFLEEFS
jgi:asparagine synthase (glutamine-hydrolysing)